MTKATDAEMGRFLALVVHDLRNPAATLAANVAFVKETLPEVSDDVREALADCDGALLDLMRGYEQVAWIGRWLAGETVVAAVDADVGEALRKLVVPAGMALVVDVVPGALRARGGSVTAKIVEVLLANAAMHARKGPVTVRAARDGDAVVVTHLDTGRALGADLREKAFTLTGQHDLKGRPDGRYGRACGLFAVRLACDAIGATVEAGGADGAATFTLRFKAA